jgi:hypothetical protein
MSQAVIIEAPVKNVLNNAGWRFVGRRRDRKVQRLQELLDSIYVDSRRKSLVKALEEARQIASEL